MQCSSYTPGFFRSTRITSRDAGDGRLSEQHREGHVLHYWLIEVDGKPAGIRTFRYVRHRHCGLAHALAIDPSYREVMIEGQSFRCF